MKGETETNAQFWQDLRRQKSWWHVECRLWKRTVALWENTLESSPFLLQSVK